MKLKALVASAAIAAAGLGVVPAAHAATDLGLIGTAWTWFGNSFGRTLSSFTDYYTFEVDGSSGVVGGTLELDLGSFYNVNVASVSLSGGGLSGSLTDYDPSNGFTFSNLLAGTYTMEVAGNVPGAFGGSYVGALHAIASPAPEPEVYAMAALGLLGVGFAARRRNKSR
jgi:MYXO-CTERM domain-containing protein